MLIENKIKIGYDSMFNVPQAYFKSAHLLKMRMPYLSMKSHYRQAQIYIDSNFRAFAWFMQFKFPDQNKVGWWTTLSFGRSELDGRAIAQSELLELR